MDWSQDENREILRQAARGKEFDVGTHVSHRVLGAFMADIGASQYSHSRLVDWMADNAPDELAWIIGS